jgi:hypothetical protein
MKKLLILLLLIPSIGFTEWEMVSSASDMKDDAPETATFVTTYYVDFSTVKKMSKSKIRALLYIDNAMKEDSIYNTSGKKMTSSFKMYTEFDCIQETYTYLSQFFYEDLELKGVAVAVPKGMLEKDKIITPGTTYKEVLDAVCKKL